MKLRNEIFFNENFIPAFKRLLDFDLDSTETVRLVRSIKILDEQQYAVMQTRNKMLSTFTLPLTSESDGLINFKSSEDAVKFEEQMTELTRDEFEIPLIEKIKLNKSHKISGNYLMALDNMVEVIDDEGDK